MGIGFGLGNLLRRRVDTGRLRMAVLAGGGVLFATGGDLPLATGTPGPQPAPPTVTVEPTAPAPPPPPPVVTTAVSEPPAPLAVEADATVQCVRGSRLLVVTATANAPLATAELTIRDGSTAPRTYRMEVDGTTARHREGPLTGPVLEWSVAVAGQDGRTAGTDPVTEPVQACPTATRYNDPVRVERGEAHSLGESTC